MAKLWEGWSMDRDEEWEWDLCLVCKLNKRLNKDKK